MVNGIGERYPGGFRWSLIVGGQSDAIVKTDARVKSPYQFLYVSKIMNIDRSTVRYEQIPRFSFLILYIIIYVLKFCMT